jgi:agmatinase
MAEARELNSSDLLTTPPTFMGAPYSTDAAGAGAAILGCPFDCGTHPFRIGSRQGPVSIREQSRLIRRFQSDGVDEDIVTKLGVIDAGDVRLTPSRIEDAFERIEEAAYRIASAGAAPIGLGGDGSVSLPLIRGCSRVHQNLAVLHIDSHTDAYPVNEEHPYDAATQFTHAAFEQRVRPALSHHIGLRGTTFRGGVYDYGRQLGYNLIPMMEFAKRGPEDVLAQLRGSIGQAPVYLSWDMDVFDPSCAPGVCTPAWGGFSAREGLGFLKAMSGLNIVAADVNTVSPPHDINGMTAFLAAAVVHEIILLIHSGRQDVSRRANS